MGPICEWARAGERYDQYCVRMAKQGEFGGGPEKIGLTQQDKISACVWRAVGRGRGQKHLFEMTSSFEVDGVQRRINLASISAAGTGQAGHLITTTCCLMEAM